ncbi:hypothetical protein V512_000715 [Mesotoga sp. Brook.08.105.5.1]|jgi:hypothetical protein|uniref:hypothetical protein n=1 Tax=Mesotoga sp. Brook.08.105.5.1 TaxID=1421002 RepID=UPI000C1789CA|nr:hypothetical protein [Mesotoga sp. Brook.08.105.5.1]PVD15467.1 hypothetical protein V512_000715 [Mesotoga sp. Brook.08.105.5.1]
MTWLLLIVPALYFDLGFGDLIPLYPAYLTLLVFLPTRNIAFVLSLALVISWIVGMALSGISMVIVLSLIVTLSALAIHGRYRTLSFGALTSAAIGLAGVFFSGTSFGVLVPFLATFCILRRLSIED